jgi:integrase
VHDALAAGTLKGYFSETLVTLEAVENKDRIDVLGSTRLDSERRATGENTISISLSVKQDAYAMIRRRAAGAGIATKLGNHSFRATGITAYLKNGGTLEKAAAMANHASTRTTQLYDRRRDEVSLDEVERIMI